VRVNESEPEWRVNESEPEWRVNESEPEWRVNESEPEWRVNESEPEWRVNESEPEWRVNESEPEWRVNESEPEWRVNESEPEWRVNESEPEWRVNESTSARLPAAESSPASRVLATASTGLSIAGSTSTCRGRFRGSRRAAALGLAQEARTDRRADRRGRGEGAVIPHGVRARRRDQQRQPADQLERLEGELRAPIGPRPLQLVRETPVLSLGEPREREGRTQAVAAQPLETSSVERVHCSVRVEGEALDLRAARGAEARRLLRMLPLCPREQRRPRWQRQRQRRTERVFVRRVILRQLVFRARCQPEHAPCDLVADRLDLGVGRTEHRHEAHAAVFAPRRRPHLHRPCGSGRSR
jgi:hypothetical protein